ncbi:MAG: hypothetical protein ACREAA_19970 [Candidatus Polarisedimenticolia bacterium]
MTKHLKSTLGVALLLGAAATTVWAGGPNHTFDYENQIPYAWRMENWPGGAVPVYTDLGNLKNSNPLITNERADQLTVQGWDQWNNVATSSFQAQVMGDFSLIGLGDINRTNALSVLGAFNGGGVHVIYDTDGQILQNVLGIFGALGVTSIEWVEDDGPEILEAWVILNGNSVRTTDINGLGFAGVFTHEFGHAVNLGHSQANGAAFGFSDPSRPRDCAAPWTVGPAAPQIETMYPFIDHNPTGSGAGMASVDRIDDIAAISNLYPEPGWPDSHGTIRGKVFLSDEETEVTAVNVIARNISDPFNDFASYISGQVSKGQVGPDGSFELNGLTAGAQYVLYADNLVQGAFNVPRLLVLPGPEEYYNGVNESGDGEDDDRCAWTTVTAATAVPATVDIALNKVKGAPVFRVLPPQVLPHDMTPDGGVIVGGAGSQVFRWTDEGGLTLLGGDMSAGGQVSVSDDGLRIAGMTRDPNNILAWALHENGAWTVLPRRPESVAHCGGNWGIVMDMSGDGSTIVGGTWGNGCATAGFRATKWTAAGGTVALAKYPDSPTRASRANAVNFDGTIFGGWDDHITGFRRGAYWMNGVVNVFEPNPSAVNIHGETLKSNSAGTILVGTNGTNLKGGWRYFTSTGVMEILSVNNGPTDRQGSAAALSEDGEVITGWNMTTSTRIPTIWTSALGWFDFNLFLKSQGTSTEGIGISNALAVSADGRRIAGGAASLFGNLGWILDTPKSVLCHRPPDHPGGKTITIDVTFPQGVPDHLAHGDTFGMCQHGGE